MLRVVVSIVISAVLLGLLVSYCVAEWMPEDALGWIVWGAAVVMSFTAVARIAALAKGLKQREE